MLTPTDKKNLKNFEKLKLNHQRVFKHRLMKKCTFALKDIEIVLSYHESLKIKINKILDVIQLVNLMDLYEKMSLLQNM